MNSLRTYLTITFLCLILSSAHAETTKTIFSPFTGKPDFITVITSGTIPAGATNYIQLTQTLQSGATFFVSSGTASDFTASTATISTGTAQNFYIVNSTVSNATQSWNAAAYGQLASFQVKYGSSTSSLSTNSSTYVDTGLGLTITPKVASHRIKLTWMSVFRAPANLSTSIVSQIAGTTNSSGDLINHGQIQPTGTNIAVPLTGVWIDSPNSTNAQTYKLQVKIFNGGLNTFEVNRDNTLTTMVAEEIL